MDFGRAFGYIFEDREWTPKVVLLAIVSMIPLLNLAVIGWTVDLIDGMLDGYDQPLPGWENFGEKFGAGLSYSIAAILYNLPLILLACWMGVLGGRFADVQGLEALKALSTCGMTRSLSLRGHRQCRAVHRRDPVQPHPPAGCFPASRAERRDCPRKRGNAADPGRLADPGRDRGGHVRLDSMHRLAGRGPRSPRR
jgi:hypothetical protein